MALAMASASTGVISSVIGKLGILLDEQYRLAKSVKSGIRFLHDELNSMHAVLKRLADMEEDQINDQIKEWRKKVRELSYDMEDCIDRFMLSHGPGDGDGDGKASSLVRFKRKMKGKIKALWKDPAIGKEIQDLKTQIEDMSKRRDRYDIDRYLNVPQSVPVDPRAQSLYQEAINPVGIDVPREEIIGWFKSGEDKQLKIVSIYGIGGLGKTTLAREVYNKIHESFDCGAYVSVSRTPNLTKILRGLLFHIDKKLFEDSERWDTEQLIPTLKDCLKCKRYLILIDDIWSESAWDDLRAAFPINNNQSRIIITTRNESVAKFCCNGIDGKMFKTKPLSEEYSRKLFFKRVFSGSEDCPEELKEVTNNILKKCDGLPLAIISIAGLLVNRNLTVDFCLKILNSISSEAVTDPHIEKMKRILFLSYFDLPHHLKSCLLYLAVFPEDYIIDCKHLIWMWVAEGLIPGQNRNSMEQQGQSYLNELINRSMVQPTKFGADGKTVKFCRVHDVILDFIVSQAEDDNFAIVWNDNICCKSVFDRIRRLCVQSNFSADAEMEKLIKINTSSLPSLIMVKSDGHGVLDKDVPLFLNSKSMRVLVIDGLSRVMDKISIMDRHITHISSFTHLKYLKITGTTIRKLPEQIGDLRNLETLDAKGSVYVSELPASIVQLRKLVRLYVPEVKMSHGIGNLQALEELSEVSIDDNESEECIQGLHKLIKLRTLGIRCRLRCLFSFGKLKDSDTLKSNMVLPASDLLSFSSATSPVSYMVNMTRLHIWIRDYPGEYDLNILANLPLLLSLTVELPIYGGKLPHSSHTIRSQGFKNLMKFTLRTYNEVALIFVPGAMPKLQRLKLSLNAASQFEHGDGCPVLGLQNLSGLKHMNLNFGYYASRPKEAEALEDDIRGAAAGHPNHPVLVVNRWLCPEFLNRDSRERMKLKGE